MSDINTINVSLLKNYQKDFNNEKNNFNNSSYNTYSSSYLKRCSDPYVLRMDAILQKMYDKLKTGYANIDGWWNSYNENIEALENSLANNNVAVGAIAESSVRSCVIKLPKLEDYSIKFAGVITPAIGVNTNNISFDNRIVSTNVANFSTLFAGYNMSGVGTGVATAGVMAVSGTISPAEPETNIFQKVGATISNGVTSIWNGIKGLFSGAAESTENFFSNVGATISNGATSALNGIKGFLGGAVESAGNFFSDVGATISNGAASALNGIKGFFGGAAESVGNFFSDVGATVSNGAASALNGIKGFFGGAVESVGNFFSEAGATISNGVSSVLGGVSDWWSGVEDWWSGDALPWIQNAASAVWDVVQSVGAAIAKGVQTVVSTVLVGVQSLVKGVGQFVEALVDVCALVVGGVASIFTGIYDLGQAIHGGITGSDWSSSTKAMWSDGFMPFVGKDHVGGWFDALYETGYGQWLNEYSAIKSDSIGANILSGIGYVAGLVALTIATLGIGTAVSGAASAGTTATGAISAAGVKGVMTLGTQAMSHVVTTVGTGAISTTITTGSLALGGTASVAGLGRGTAEAWSNGAEFGEGLLYGGASGLWEGFQFFLGGTINNFSIGSVNTISKVVGNSLVRIGMDSATGAAEGFVKPAMQLIYLGDNGHTYQELFEASGGMVAVGTQALIGAGSSLIGEIPNVRAGIKEVNFETNVKSVFGDGIDAIGKNLEDTIARISVSSLTELLFDEKQYNKFLDFDRNTSSFGNYSQVNYVNALTQLKQVVDDMGLELNNSQLARLNHLTSTDFVNYALFRNTIDEAFNARYENGRIKASSIYDTTRQNSADGVMSQTNLKTVEIDAKSIFELVTDTKKVEKFIKNFQVSDVATRQQMVAAIYLLDDINQGKINYNFTPSEISNLYKISEAYNVDTLGVNEVLNQLTDKWLLRKAALVSTHFDDLDIKIHIPNDVNTKMQAVTVDQVKATMEQLPFELRKSVKDIYIWDMNNPNDIYWNRAYGNSSFKSAATGGMGEINIYAGFNGNLLDTLAHEAGHNFDSMMGKHLNVPSGRISLSKEWATAAETDFALAKMVSPTEYGATNMVEDFAESIANYFVNKDFMETQFWGRTKVIEHFLKMSDAADNLDGASITRNAYVNSSMAPGIFGIFKNNNVEKNIDIRVDLPIAQLNGLAGNITDNINFINARANQGLATILVVNSISEIPEGMLRQLNNPDLVNVRIISGLSDTNRYSAQRYIDRTTYSLVEAIKINDKIDDIISRVNRNASQLDQARQVYEILARDIPVARNYKNLGQIETNAVQGLRSLIDNRGAICAGYSMSYKEILNKLGIQCEYIRGKVNVDWTGQAGVHAWNVVVIDGKTYPVDVTWKASGNSDWFGNSEAFSNSRIADSVEVYKDYNIKYNEVDISASSIKNSLGLQQTNSYSNIVNYYQRNDGSGYALNLIGQRDIDGTRVYKYSYANWNQSRGMFDNAKIIYSESDVRTLNASDVQRFSSSLLDNDRVNTKINDGGGYVGYIGLEGKKHLNTDIQKQFLGPQKNYIRSDGTTVTVNSISNGYEYNTYGFSLENGQVKFEMNTYYSNRLID